MAAADKLKKEKPAKVEAAKKETTEVENIDVIALVQEQFKANNEGEEISKKLVKQVLSAYHTILTEATFKNGKVRLGEFGALITVPVAGREGVAKMGGTEKAWKTKDHWTIKLRLFPGTSQEIDALEEETKDFAKDALKA